MNEYVRVTKPGGYVGINEVTWIKEPTGKLKSMPAPSWPGQNSRMLTAGKLAAG